MGRGLRRYSALVLALMVVGACGERPAPAPSGGTASGEPSADGGDGCTLEAGCSDAGNATGSGGYGGQGGGAGDCSGATSCDDGDACTEDVCSAGQCTHTPVVVDDGDACTIDSCNAVSGVSHIAVYIDDGDACTVDSCDAVTGVSHNAVDIDDGDSCTTDTCDPVSGPSHAAVNVDDGDACTLDSCDPAAGTTHALCSAIDPTVATTMADATAFLYSGASPVQTGVATDAIDVTRAAVVHGHVRRGDGAPLQGIQVEVQEHPELGSTRTLADGTFWMAVNGGGPLIVTFEADGYLRVARQVEVPWQDYVRAADVVMTPYDNQVTVIDLASQSGIAVARGSVAADVDGVRQATVLFPAGTGAEMVLPGGAVQPLTTLSVRATEYTVGETGLAAMPATLPPASAYTYAVELSVDEAIAAGATTVQFTQALPFYLENFLDFPVGTDVPSGYYDFERAVWVPSANGRVVEVLGIAGTLAEVDTDGDGAADDAGTLLALGITDAERSELATLYAPGQTLWRVPMEHFTPCDLNWVRI